MESVTNRLLEGVKVKLGLDLDDTTQDKALVLEISDLLTEVLAYIDLDVLPVALEPFIKRKVVAYIKSGETGVSVAGTHQVKTVTRGDTTISYLAGSERLTTKDIEVLDRFKARKVYAR